MCYFKQTIHKFFWRGGTAPRVHKNSPFPAHKSKKFSGEGHSSLPHPHGGCGASNPHSKILGISLLADGVEVSYLSVDTVDAVMFLLACYYSWDLCYRCHYQALCFFHLLVLGEKVNTRKTTNFLKLEKLIDYSG